MIRRLVTVTRRVLFVCMGNICRSPMAEGVFRQLVHGAGLEPRIVIDSAGTLAHTSGHPPDPRAVAAARRRGIDISGLRARRFRDEDFTAFDRILVMDQDNRDELLAHAPAASHSRIQLLLDATEDLAGQEVPDPYHGTPQDFERVLDLVGHGARALLVTLRRELEG
jgi:protein-tyrosine phosphatase